MTATLSACTAPLVGGAIILAAGRGTRFGTDKRRATLPSGITLLAATVRRYAEVFDNLIVMLRDDERELGASLSHLMSAPTQTIGYSLRAAGGMGFTLADAVALIANSWQFVLVALGDMPFVTFTTLRQLRATMVAPTATAPTPPERRILLPIYLDEPGHPVGFSSDFFAELAALTEDRGARSVVRTHPDAVQRVTFTDPGIVMDVDTPEALAQSNWPKPNRP